MIFQGNFQLIRNYLFTYLFLVPITIFLPFRQTIFIMVFIIAALLFFMFKKNFGKYFYVFFVLTICSLLLQIFYFDRFNFSSTVRLFMNILLPYFLVMIIGKNFLKYFINIVYFIAIISLLFYIPSVFSDSIHSAIGKIAPTLGTDAFLADQNFIIYTWEEKSDFFLRNSGNFTEPGYFAAILCLAISFNILHYDKLFNKKNIVFIIAIISTFSTAGYIALFYIITIKLVTISNSKYRFLLIPLMLTLSYQAYVRLDFLQNKVTSQYQTQVEEGFEVGRFGSTMLDIEDIKKYPIIGRGQTKSTRFDEVEFWEGDEAPRPILNSITDTILKYGIFGFIIYLILLIKSVQYYLKIHNITNNGIYLILGAIFLVTSSQPVLLTPIFLSLIFIKDINNNAKTIDYNSQLQLR